MELIKILFSLRLFQPSNCFFFPVKAWFQCTRPMSKQLWVVFYLQFTLSFSKIFSTHLKTNSTQV